MNFAERIQSLYQLFGGLEGISIECQKELIAIGVVNKAARAEVFLQGAQVTAYQRHGEEPILFLSKECEYKEGFPLRGGIPICWPWFGDLEKNNDQLKAQFPTGFVQASEAHGFVRNCEWELKGIDLPSDSLSILTFEYNLDRHNPFGWPFSAKLVYEVHIGHQLAVSLKIKNTDTRMFISSGALHTYFLVSDIKNTKVLGLGECEYVDALKGWTRDCQNGAVDFTGEVDRIYQLEAELNKVELVDNDRSLMVASEGSRSLVVWNPRIKKSQNLSQFSAEDYKKMVCIETANAGDDIIYLEPGQEHVLAVIIE